MDSIILIGLVLIVSGSISKIGKTQNAIQEQNDRVIELLEEIRDKE